MRLSSLSLSVSLSLSLSPYNEICVVTVFNITCTHYDSTSAKIAALEAKLRQMEEEDVGVTGGVATKKPRISTSRTARDTPQVQDQQTMFKDILNLLECLITL